MAARKARKAEQQETGGTIFSREDVAAMQFCTFPGGYSPNDTREDCTFDVAAAWKAVSFGPLILKHTKGAKGGQPLFIEKWQAEFLATIFGWKRPDGTRRYRDAYLEIPRGNGKSTMCMIVVGLLMFVDEEPGAEIFSAAGTKEQAKEVFGPFKINCLSSPSLMQRSKAYLNSIVRKEPQSGMETATYKAIPADADFQHGGSPHGIIFDELHVQPDRELWDVLHTGKIKRRQPLTVAITTAGYDLQSICWEVHSYAEKVRDGIIADAAFLPVIYAAGVKDDWTQPETWRKANPNIGVSIMEEALAKECKRAQDVPAYENTFKRLHLNIWSEQETRTIPMRDWDECCPDVDAIKWRSDMLQKLKRSSCFGGLDLSSRIDVSAFVLEFVDPDEEDAVIWLPWFWIPQEAISRRAREPRNTGRYQQWAQAGFMEVIPGERIDQAYIRKAINELGQHYQIQQIAYDPWNADSIRIQLEEDGFDMLEFVQGMRSFTEPTKDMLSLVQSHKVRHGNNPVLRWMASNMAGKTDAADNIKPDKQKSGDKIDGMVAGIMAHGLALTEDNDSVYVSRGAVSIGDSDSGDSDESLAEYQSVASSDTGSVDDVDFWG